MSYNLKVCPDDDTLTLRDCCGLRYSTKGPLKDYVILLGGGGRSPKDYVGLQLIELKFK